MVVVGIVAILVSLLSLSVRSIRAGFALRNAASVVVSEVRRAQAAALADGLDYTVEFVCGAPVGSVLPTGAACAAGTSRPAIKVYRGATLMRQVSGAEWPSTVYLLLSAPPSKPTAVLSRCGSYGSYPGDGDANKSRCVTFTFLGAPVPGSVGTGTAGYVLLQSETSGQMWVSVQAATGRVGVEP